MSLNAPTTPTHPAANEEIRYLPEGQLDIDLNPDLDDDDDDDQVMDSNHMDVEGGFIKDQSIDQTHQLSQHHDIEPDTQPRGSPKPNLLIDFRGITPTFEESYEATRLHFTAHEEITGPQQSKLINYLDEQLLKIQRVFIKTQSGEINSTIGSIIEPLYTNAKLVWLSISPGSHGNVEYFIKILNDLEDYVSFYNLNIGDRREFFEFLQFLDVKLSYLHDVGLFSSTGLIRVVSIISRLRIVIIDKFSQSESRGEVETEVSRLFEGLLERS
ncbi:hypothetical protein PSN45_002944 [Yamadazyma tenuis]|uniref:Uncharacterized protein n=1 Tax=Candida tenuis (strain ATCC 10573 / BCRC 21748 / CBS 615 / JCM 9827 / NBRC 10315 / NRRL Y-1498 / VKM Y-70) TaxID=590646 RepID=G3AW53_CANTC|nr:uncharacterized protein CANTEDRAFT_112185 [Yamadazyma tenuis ATCC 10573]EGV66455.1 hypothetical protein CANTEDRAFT_112185 [Yamadazyma tenuis ATCC 10573]WEJ95425.1 hypothetical protein PSN45_002944 [Yamadazyma tenuis]